MPTDQVDSSLSLDADKIADKEMESLGLNTVGIRDGDDDSTPLDHWGLTTLNVEAKAVARVLDTRLFLSMITIIMQSMIRLIKQCCFRIASIIVAAPTLEL
jgi:hypothetical protein